MYKWAHIYSSVYKTNMFSISCSKWLKPTVPAPLHSAVPCSWGWHPVCNRASGSYQYCHWRLMLLSDWKKLVSVRRNGDNAISRALKHKLVHKENVALSGCVVIRITVVANGDHGGAALTTETLDWYLIFLVTFCHVNTNVNGVVNNFEILILTGRCPKKGCCLSKPLLRLPPN